MAGGDPLLLLFPDHYLGFFIIGKKMRREVTFLQCTLASYERFFRKILRNTRQYRPTIRQPHHSDDGGGPAHAGFPICELSERGSITKSMPFRVAEIIRTILLGPLER